MKFEYSYFIHTNYVMHKYTAEPYCSFKINIDATFIILNKNLNNYLDNFKNITYINWFVHKTAHANNKSCDIIRTLITFAKSNNYKKILIINSNNMFEKLIDTCDLFIINNYIDLNNIPIYTLSSCLQYGFTNYNNIFKSFIVNTNNIKYPLNKNCICYYYKSINISSKNKFNISLFNFILHILTNLKTHRIYSVNICNVKVFFNKYLLILPPIILSILQSIKILALTTTKPATTF